MSLLLDANTVLLLTAQETADGASLIDVSGYEATGLTAAGTPLALQTGPVAGIFSRFADGLNNKYFTRIASSSAWLDAVQNQYTLDLCYSPKLLSSVGDVRTIYALSSASSKFLWLYWQKSTGKIGLDWTHSTEQFTEFDVSISEDAWYYLSVRKTVTSGSTVANRISTLEFWHRPISGSWGSDTPDHVATGQLNPNDTNPPNNSVGAYWQGSAGFKGSFGIAGLRGSNSLRSATELRTAFTYYKTGQLVEPTAPEPVPVVSVDASSSSATSRPARGDIGLTWGYGGSDFDVSAGDLTQDGGFDTAIFLSLFIDRQAASGDILPDAETDRRGWWGDEFAEDPTDKIGSRLWLLARAKQTQDTLDRAKDYCREALAWLVDDQITDSVDVTTAFLGRGVMVISIVVARPAANPVVFRYNYNWASQLAQAA